jgi:hypothetical protein
MLLPYLYVIIVIIAVKADLIDWILLVYIITGLVIVYSHIKIYLVSITNLDVDNSVKMPEKRKVYGRIIKKHKEIRSRKDTNF